LKWFFDAIGLSVLINGCNKLIDPGEPTNRITDQDVYSKDSVTLAALFGVYTEMMAERRIDLKRTGRANVILVH
jgi:hypothetical protein